MKNLQTDNSGEAFTFFALLYLPFFTFLYGISGFGSADFIPVFFLFALKHIPSFIILFFAHHYLLGKERRIPDLWYIVASIVLFIISFYGYAEFTENPPNLFPVVFIPITFLFVLGIIAHILVYVFLRLVYAVVTRSRNRQHRS